jgi:hypothetical protein
VLFFFELGLFVLIMLTLALAEFVSRGLALGVWLACTAASLIGYVLARRSLSPPKPATADRPETLDETWARTLLYTWRRTNVLLLLGALLVGGWYRLSV